MLVNLDKPFINELNGEEIINDLTMAQRLGTLLYTTFNPFSSDDGKIKATLIGAELYKTGKAEIHVDDIKSIIKGLPAQSLVNFAVSQLTTSLEEFIKTSN